MFANSYLIIFFNPLNTKPTKWSNTLKQFVGNLTTNCLSVFDHFVKLALKELMGLIDSSIQHSKEIESEI